LGVATRVCARHALNLALQVGHVKAPFLGQIGQDALDRPLSVPQESQQQCFGREQMLAALAG
jgi:hypothetical protein